MLTLRTTLRGRLTLLYISLVLVVLLLYAGGASIFFWQKLIGEMDRSLSRDVETVENLIVGEPDGKIRVDTGDESQELLLEIWSPHGDLLYQSPELGGEPLGPRVSPSDPHHPPNRSVHLANNKTVRVITVPHKLGTDSVIVRLGLSENVLRAQFVQMISALALGLPLALIIVGLTGNFVARRALQPLDSMARRAKQINAEHLNERLTIENPDDELGHLGSAFNGTLSKLEHSFGHLKRFTADASHELRTPLTAMRSVGEVALQNPADDHSHREAIGSMLEEVYRLTHLVESLLILSRAESEHLVLQRSEVSLRDLAAESVTLLEVLAEEKHQSLKLQGGESPAVSGDPLILRQALVAVIHNAVKYSPAHGNIEVRVGATNGTAFIEVHDSGPGIPREHRAKVFERFYRVDSSRTRDIGGAGLGLSIADWAVKAHGGKIDLKCEGEPGCTFRINLPVGTK
jgi:heavy metal sensor kinase